MGTLAILGPKNLKGFSSILTTSIKQNQHIHRMEITAIHYCIKAQQIVC